MSTPSSRRSVVGKHGHFPNIKRRLTRTPHAFIKAMTRSNITVAGAMPKPGPQYCVNIAAAMVRVTMLMQLASLTSPISTD